MKKSILEKGINNLYHFTDVRNLENIFKYGVVPRSILDKRNIEHIYNDEYRFDKCKNAVCISIEFPNYKMFYKLRTDNKKRDWAVLEIDKGVLLDYDCAYCWLNAGDHSMYSCSIEERKEKAAFLELFNDRDGYPKREKTNLPCNYPTHPQAEVLVFGTIKPQYIKKVFFDKKIILEKYKKKISDDTPFELDVSKFGPREDYGYWQNKEILNGN